MRELKFRGKSKRGNEWVFGSLVELDGRTFIVGSNEGWLYRCYSKSVRNLDVKDAWEVQPESVGQFTGLKDKNGKCVYEGDVIKGKSIYKPMTITFDDGSYVYDDGDGNLLELDFGRHMEVIGTIHEHPELLK